MSALLPCVRLPYVYSPLRASASSNRSNFNVHRSLTSKFERLHITSVDSHR